MNGGEKAPHANRAMSEPLRVAHIVAYRDVSFPRNASVVRALEQTANVRVKIAHNLSTGWQRYFETWRSFATLRRQEKPDIYVFGFRSHEFFWPFILGLDKKPVVFDALMSPYGALKQERKLGWRGRLLAPAVFLLERSILRRADLILTDTISHVNYYQQTFKLPPEKLCAVPVSAPDLEARALPATAPSGMFSVLFFGSFLPLHGIDTIIQAAALLRHLPIHFKFVGGAAKQLENACKLAGITRYSHETWVPFNRLLDHHIPAAHLCLGGPFGSTQQAQRVITTKATQCLAAARATVIGRIETDAAFMDKHNCLLVEQANPKALAETIRWAYEHSHLLAAIGENGRKLYDAQLSTRVIAERLVPRLIALIEERRA